ncbi:MAG TPA: tyrosine-type recombinase/integrase, partial [Streptosporangiaceae bacterium]|nr:tyrosine-type recombinase/integrase [Streptosporangiaceae bacterium]
QIRRGDGRRAYTIVLPGGGVHGEPDGFLRRCAGGTDRTYAYLLVDHLRWLEFEGLSLDTVRFADLQRYMAAVGAEYPGPAGRPWRAGRRPYGQGTLGTAAACLKGFYVYRGAQGRGAELAEALRRDRLPTQADRRRLFLGHAVTRLPANPLAPARSRRRHPKMPPEGARQRLAEALALARDRLTVTWLADGGFRVGELCGLHLIDLHLRDGAGCGECRAPHVHICHREANPNQARAKTKHPWDVRCGTVRGGLIRRASPAMIHAYFEYMTTEYPRDCGHGMLLVQLHGPGRGQPWAPAGVRGMLRRAGIREDLGSIRPHQFRHGFATSVLDASGGNAIIARDAGGWASATTVDQVYGHADVHDPVFAAALSRVWDEQL